MVEHFDKEYWILNKQQEYRKESNVNEYDAQCIYQWPQFHRIIDQWHFSVLHRYRYINSRGGYVYCENLDQLKILFLWFF